VWCRGDLLDAENFGKLFLSFFYRFLLQIQHPEAGISGRTECRNALRSNNSVTKSMEEQGVEIKSRKCASRSCFRLRIRKARAIFFREQL
jgi:hypothetical protein